jgi:carboxypeptidase Q
MRSRAIATLVLVAACATSPQRTQPTPPAPSGAASALDTATQQFVRLAAESVAIERLVREGTERSRVREDLSYLLDVIGPRLSGSAGMKRANDWTQSKLHEYGIDSAWQEPWTFGVTWERGPISVTMLAPHRRELIGVSWAWSPGTNGTVEGSVVMLDARTESAYRDRFAGKLRGAWVMLAPATVIPNPDGPVPSRADSARIDSLRRAQFTLNAEEQAFAQMRTGLLVQEGVAGVLRDGAKEFALFTMSGSPAAISPVVQVVLPNETYAQFERLARRGETVRLAVNVRNALGIEPVQQFNTIGEIRGSERPDEVVLLGAHLDSWDLATGATDNGAGSIAVLEAARILKAAGVRPRRTIRFALFSGEEQGLFGSQAYVRAHAADLAKHHAVLVLDNGTGRITAMALQGRNELRDLWRDLFAPIASLGPFRVRDGNKGGTDHLPFLAYGVPAFNYDQLTRGYNHTHHSQVDVLDHAVPEDVMQAAIVMAVNAYQLASLDSLLPRGPVVRR